MEIIFKHFLKKYLIAGIIFLILSPLFFIIIQPQKDFVYNFVNFKPLQIDKTSIIDNEVFAECSGQYKKGTFKILYKGKFDNKISFLFMLKDYKSPVVVHLIKGKLFDKINKVIKKYHKDNFFNQINDEINDEFNREVEGILYKENKFIGHLYPSDGIFDNFDRYYYKKINDIVDYISDNGYKLKNPVYKGFFRKMLAEKNDGEISLWLLSSEEKPSVKNIVETKGVIFLFGIILGIAGIIFYINKTRYKPTKLIRAIQKKNIEEAQNLIIKGNRVDEKDSIGCSPLHWAVAVENLTIIENLFIAEAYCNIKGYNDATPLHWSISTSNKELIEILLKHNGDMYAKDKNDLTAFDWAIANNNADIIELFFEFKFDIAKTKYNNMTKDELLKIIKNENMVNMIINHNE